DAALVVVIAGAASGPDVDIPTIHVVPSCSPALVRSVRGGAAAIISCTRACISSSLASVSASVGGGSSGRPAATAMSARNRRTIADCTADRALTAHPSRRRSGRRWRSAPPGRRTRTAPAPRRAPAAESSLHGRDGGPRAGPSQLAPLARIAHDERLRLVQFV